jgi:hypothetical protein
MRPDLRNISIISEGKGDRDRKVIARHRAFPELRGEGRSPAEGLLALLGLLKRASGWVEDAWHNLELERAVFDVESMLKLMVSSDNINICGFNCTITKRDDLVYVLNRPAGDDTAAGSVLQDPSGPDGLGDQDEAIVIYSVGRRYSDRRLSGPGAGRRAGRPERRHSERRSVDRRQFNRLKLIDEITGG